jgi:dihydroorotate dehydrogenase (fumarate)
MNLTTRYLGLELRNPLVASASPLSEDLDQLRRLEDAGAAAIVFHSMFEEQIRQTTNTQNRGPGFSEPEASQANSYFPDAQAFHAAPDRYLRHLEQAKRSLGVPVIGSLNGTSFGGWTTYARAIEQAGADALELNLYSIPSNPDLAAEEIEASCLTIIASVKAQVKIPVAVKLSPFFTNFAHFARRVDRQGADGLVLFNRFYQPDIDIETLKVTPNLNLSSGGEMRLPLRWIAMLHGRLRASLAATSGIHRGADVLKLLLAGADVTMLCSVLLRHGIEHLAVIERELCEAMETYGFVSVQGLRGTLSQKNCPDPSAFERAQYVRVIATEREIQSAT